MHNSKERVKNGGTSVQRILLRMRKLVVKSAGLETDHRIGEEETLEGNWTRSATTARTSWSKFTLLVFCKKNCRKYVESQGMDMRRETECCSEVGIRPDVEEHNVVDDFTGEGHDGCPL